MDLSTEEYKSSLRYLQTELCKMQEWLQDTGGRVIVIFEGRDSAGKGGMIRTLTERVSKRVFRTVALPKPTERERTQFYAQRYIAHFPAAGEVILFDRSWYNRAGVEPVMGFCTPQQSERFLKETPGFERSLVDAGLHLVKYWLEIDQDVQKKRLGERLDDPRKHWKLSGMDLVGHERWYDYSRARDRMLDATDTTWAPWTIIPANNSKLARLNCMSHFLSQFPYRATPFEAPEMPEVDRARAYDDKASLQGRKFVPDVDASDLI